MGKENILSFWRMCRAVSTENRLRLLWALFDTKELCVWQLAEAASLKKPVASAQLKILYSCGLIRFRREGMRVIYRAEASRRIEHAEDLLDLLNRLHEHRIEFDTVIRLMTAFTHERRIEIVRELQREPCSFMAFAERCGMTTSALSRHLQKLEARRFVRWDGKLYRIVSPPDWPTGRLLDMACNGAD